MNNDSYHSAKRWIPFRNTSSETIPAYACVAFPFADPDSEDGQSIFFAHEYDGEQLIWNASMPTDDHVHIQDAALMAANSGVAVPPNGWGECTQDWPAKILHRGDNDSAGNGKTVGPLAGFPYLHTSGITFTVVSHDAAGAVSDDNKQHCIWVAPTSRRVSPAIVLVAGAGGVANMAIGKHFFETGGWSANDGVAIPSPLIRTTSDSTVPNTPLFPDRGNYMGVANATMYPQATPSVGEDIGFGVYSVSPSNVESFLGFAGIELTQSEYDEYGAVLGHSKHHICVPFFFNVPRANTGIRFRNHSSIDITHVNFRVVMWTQSQWVPPSASE